MAPAPPSTPIDLYAQPVDAWRNLKTIENYIEILKARSDIEIETENTPHRKLPRVVVCL